MANIREIMKIVGCDQPTAYRIFNLMSANGIDFSECTHAEFRRAVKQAVYDLAAQAV